MEAELAELKFELERLRADVNTLARGARSTVAEEFNRAGELIVLLLSPIEETGDKDLIKVHEELYYLVCGNQGAEVILEMEKDADAARKKLEKALSAVGFLQKFIQ